MSKKSFILSSSGLKNIVFTSKTKEDDFYFVFGEKEICMNRILAEFISPRVSHIHQTDPTIDKIQLISSEQLLALSLDTFFTTELLEVFSKLVQGNKLEIDESMSHQLLLLSIILDNSDLYKEISVIYPIDESSENLEQYLKIIEFIEDDKQSTHLSLPFCKESLIEYISSHFYLIDKKQLLQMSKKNLYLIISNPQLRIKDESALFEFINELYLNSDLENENEMPTKSDFYEEVVISELKSDEQKTFIKNIESDEMTSQLWSNIRSFILEENNKPEARNKRYIEAKSRKNDNCIEVEYTNERFKGIITKLGNGDSKKALTEGAISIASSSVRSGDNVQAKNVVDYEDDKQVFESLNNEKSWLSFDFIKNKVRPSHYSIRSTNYGAKNECLQHWCIEGSNDNENWKILDTRSDEKSLLENRAENTFSIKNNLEKDEYYRYLRIRQTGLNSSGNNELFFSSIEFFGNIQTSS